MSEIVSRKAAREAGERFYFTGKPCPRGHISKRRVGNFNCVACEADTNAAKAEYISEWQRKNKDRVATRNARWRDANREQHRAYNRRWINENPDKANAATAARRARIKKATPPWADMNAIKAFYRHAARLTRRTGIVHEVDHIAPLAGKGVCGLHVHWNLRVVERGVNRRKGNRLS